MKLRFKWILGGAVFGTFMLMGVAAFLAQDNIVRFLMNPRTPYETYTPPETPDYLRPSSWLLYPSDPASGDAAVFYVHSTTYSDASNWNGPILDAKSGSLLSRTVVPNEAGPFRDGNAVFAPRYRQATLYSFFTLKYQGRAARATAYSDVRNAFVMFEQAIPQDKPIILVGYEQGGLHVQTLLAEFFQRDTALRQRLVAAYIIDHPTPLDMFERELAQTPPCETPDQIRCIISWSSFTPERQREIQRMRNRMLVMDSLSEWRETKDRPLLCTNPVSWTRTGNLIGADAHKGAASATGLKYEDEPAIIRQTITTQCDDGIVMTNKPVKRYLRRSRYFGKQWAPLTYNLFYEDIRLNVAARIATMITVMSEEATRTEPIEIIENITPSPIKKVPR